MLKNLISITAAALALTTCGTTDTCETPFSIAHRGGHIKDVIPENSIAAVEMAARYGYRAIECDVHYTLDSVLVCMHDPKINRVMRIAEGYQEIPEPVKYRDVNYDELRSQYVLASSDPSLRTPIASFEEILTACKENGIIALLHTNEPEAFKRANEVLGPEGFIAFDTSYEAMQKAREISRECMILWDPNRMCADSVIMRLQELGGPCGISSMKKDLFTAEYVGAVRKAGFSVQASIFTIPGDIVGIENGCNIILSDFSLFPPENSPVREKPVVFKRAKNEKLAAGESISINGDFIEYGSFELALTFTGTIELKVNDDIEYTLEGNERFLQDGWRFYKKNPSLTITAKEESVITLRADLFEY